MARCRPDTRPRVPPPRWAEDPVRRALEKRADLLGQVTRHDSHRGFPQDAKARAHDLPVLVEHGGLVGVVNRPDLLAALTRGDAENRTEILGDKVIRS